MREDVYRSKLYKLIIFFPILILLLLSIRLFSPEYDVSLSIVNFVLCSIAIPCAIFYYTIRNQNEFYIYIFVFISIFIEQLAGILFTSNPLTINNPYSLAFILRTLLLIVILKAKDDLINFIGKIKVSFSIVCGFLILLFMFLDNFVLFPFVNNQLLHLAYNSVIFYFYIVVFRLSSNAIKSKDFIRTIYVLVLIILGLRVLSFIFRVFLHLKTERIILIEYFSFSFAFAILVVGLLIELRYTIVDNKVLNRNVKNISNSISEIKTLENFRNQFFANISHELKTPLNIIFSCIQLLNSKDSTDYYSLGKSYANYSNVIKQNCYRMIRLINNIVDINKIDSGFMHMDFHNYEIVSLVENITMSVVPYVKSKKINITFDTLIEELEIKCDSDSIERIVLNLLSNSIKFTNENGNILVYMSADDNFVTISVKDDGIGIEEEKQSRIFDIFVQGDNSLTRKKEGSGIGLSLVKSLVTLHNGQVYLESSENIGTKITVKIPNIKLDNDEFISHELDNTSNSIVSKIHIEFSDIYD